MEEESPILMHKSKLWLPSVFFRIDVTSVLYSEIMLRVTICTICISLHVHGEHT